MAEAPRTPQWVPEGLDALLRFASLSASTGAEGAGHHLKERVFRPVQKALPFPALIHLGILDV